MTKISEIHGIPTGEFNERGAEVNTSGFVPYLSLTQGEMQIWLAAQKAKMLAQWYGKDRPQYTQAAQLLENALYANLHGATNYFGALPDALQPIARLISTAKRRNRPASVGGIMARRGAGIGAIIPTQDRLKACIEYAKKQNINNDKKAEEYRKCIKRFEKENIINANLVNMAPHMVYKNLPANQTLPTEVVITRKLHRLGVEGISGVADITDYSLVYQWVENGILQKNLQGGVGPFDSVQTSYALSPNADALLAAYVPYNIKDNKMNGIGIAPLVLAAIVTVVTAAITAAFAYLSEIRKTEILAMSEAKGFGTPEFSAKQSDWMLSGTNPPTTAGISPMLLIGGAAALFLLMDDKN